MTTMAPSLTNTAAALVPRSTVVPISIRTEREPIGGLQYVVPEDASAYVDLLSQRYGFTHEFTNSETGSGAALTYAGVPGGPAQADAGEIIQAYLLQGMVLMIDPKEAGEEDVLLYATSDPVTLAVWCGPPTEGSTPLAVLAFDAAGEQVIQQARDILIAEAKAAEPVPLTELRPDLKQLVKEYRGATPATTAQQAGIMSSPWTWAIGAAVLAVGFYAIYWEPRHRGGG